MEKRRLGTSDLEITTIGFGAWAIGGAFWGDDVVDEDSVAAVRKAVEVGINFIDTAQAYGLGHSEKMVARALVDVPRDSVIVATKTGLNWDDTGRIFNDNSPEYVLKSCDDSLERLQLDVIDLLQVHWPDAKVPIPETAAAMKQLLDGGKIRAVGVSNFNVEQMQEWMTVCPLHSLQPPYSMLNRGIEASILPFCAQNNIGVLAYSPMARGLLTGKYDENVSFPESDARRGDGLWQGERLARNVAAVREMKALAESMGHTMAQLALAWVLAQPGMTCALAGSKRPAQTEETAQASGWALDADTLARIDAILQAHGAG